jgi:SAM-dependent methyltransferase
LQQDRKKQKSHQFGSHPGNPGFIMTALSGLLMLCLLAVAGWVGYVVISGLFVWPPPIPTSPHTRRRMIEAIEKLRPAGATGGLIFDPGSGFGGLALALARAFPEGEVVGIDLQPLPLLVAQLRARLLGLRNVTFRRGDLFKEDYRGAQVIACYLFGNVMEQLYAKWDAELQDGCVVVSNLHPMPHWQPIQVIPATDWTFGTRAIYAYRLPEARTRGKGAENA